MAELKCNMLQIYLLRFRQQERIFKNQLIFLKKKNICIKRNGLNWSLDLNEAIDLANVLRAGKLPASAEIIQSEIVGPSLGKEAIQSGMYSFIIALIFVLIWMVFYYGSSGFYADIALILNILLILKKRMLDKN